MSNTNSCNCQFNQSNTTCSDNDYIEISGRVTHNRQPICNATVVVMHDSCVVAECQTNSEGCYEFRGRRRCYTLCAHKCNMRSETKHVRNLNGNRCVLNFEIC